MISKKMHDKDYELIRDPILESRLLVFIKLAIFALILTPSIRLPLIPSIRVEQIATLLFTIALLVSSTLKEYIKLRNKQFYIAYAVFAVFMFFSIIAGSARGIDLIFNDLFEYYKVYLYLMFYLLTTNIIRTDEARIGVLNWFLICAMISVVIAAQQYFDLFDLNEKYIPYIAPTQSRTLLNNHPGPRSVGMTSNPNEYALIPGIGMVISWVLLLHRERKYYLLTMMICAIGLVFSQSRSGMVFTFISVAAFTAIYIIRSLKLKDSMTLIKATTIVALAIILSVVLFFILPDRYTWRFMEGLDLSTSTSFQARLSRWQNYLPVVRSHLIFGIGPAKSLPFTPAIDNEWLLLLGQYGVVGTLALIATALTTFIFHESTVFKYLYISILIGAAIFMMAAPIYHRFQIMPIIVIIAGLCEIKEKDSGNLQLR